MFSHIKKNNQPGMVDVSEKDITHRTAKASALIQLPNEIKNLVEDGEIESKKRFKVCALDCKHIAEQKNEIEEMQLEIDIDRIEIEVLSTGWQAFINCNCLKSSFKSQSNSK